jgi:hypothetical protein
MLPLVRASRARARPTRPTTFWRDTLPVLPASQLPRPFATSLAWRSSEAVERPHSSTPEPEPEEKETELNLPLKSQLTTTGTSDVAGAAPTGVEDEDGNLIVSNDPAAAPAPPREVVKGQVYVSNVFPVQLGKFECVRPV